ncbi:hypothetical protein [Citromicrobium bathyomarinum]|uniref:hypothetical protein n=1 Tax=Citromicrobium bathyomarinum TaxID=72174 RepID=UPI00315A2817
MRNFALLLIAPLSVAAVMLPSALVAANEDNAGPEKLAAMNKIEAQYGALAAAPERFAEVDLDGDGSPEILGYIRSPETCGSGGCTLMVFDMKGGELVSIGRIPASRLPVSIYPESHGGFRDLGVTTACGGYGSAIRRVPFIGSSYAPSAWDDATTKERRHGTIVLRDQ